MEFTTEEKKAFYKDGYVILRGVVPGVMVKQARKAIHIYMRDNVVVQGKNFGLSDHPDITDLFNKTPITTLSESLVGPGKLAPTNSAAIKLNFPCEEENWTVRGHLDIGNKLRQGIVSRALNQLIVVLLQDVPVPFMGNFTYWPGSHRAFEKAFRADPNYVKTAETNRKLPEVDLPHEGVQFTGKAGDIIICHHQMYHTAAPNNSADIRYAAIFRPRHIHFKENSTNAMVDIWLEFDGVKKVCAESEALSI